MILFTLLCIIIGIVIVAAILAALGFLGLFGDIIVCILLVWGVVSLIKWIVGVCKGDK